MKRRRLRILMLVVAVVGARTELHFLDFDDLLLGLGVRSLFLLEILELAVVHQAADRGLRRCGDLDQVHVVLAGHPQGVHQAHNAERLVFRAVQSHHGCGDLSIEPVFALDIGSPAVSKGSDGANPSGRLGKIRTQKQGVVNTRGKPPTRPESAGAPWGNGRRGASDLGGDVLSELLLEVCKRHHAEIPVAPGAHRNGPACLFLVADDEDERNLLQ